MDSSSVIIAFLTSVPVSTVIVKIMDNHYNKEKDKQDATEKAQEALMEKFRTDLAETKQEIASLKEENKTLNTKLDEIIAQKIRAEYDRDYYKALFENKLRDEGGDIHANNKITE